MKKICNKMLSNINTKKRIRHLVAGVNHYQEYIVDLSQLKEIEITSTDILGEFGCNLIKKKKKKDLSYYIK